MTDLILTLPCRLAQAIGYDTVFWLFAGVCLGGVLFVSKLVPETKGRTLEQVQAFFATGKGGGRGQDKAVVVLSALITTAIMGVTIAVTSL